MESIDYLLIFEIVSTPIHTSKLPVKLHTEKQINIPEEKSTFRISGKSTKIDFTHCLETNYRRTDQNYALCMDKKSSE